MNAIQLELPNVIDHKLEARLSKWRIEISHDDWCDSPRTWSNLGAFFVSNRNRYIKNESDLDWDDFTTGDLSKDISRLEKMGYIVYTVSIYDHSGVSIYIGSPCDRWDSGIIGFYLINKFYVYDEWKCKRISPKLRANLDKIAEEEVETFSNWVNGDVWEVRLLRNDGGETEEGSENCVDVELENIGSLFGDSDEALEQAWDYFPSEFTDAFTIAEAKEFAEVIY